MCTVVLVSMWLLDTYLKQELDINLTEHNTSLRVEKWW